jgi:FeS assembly SUF system protein
MNEPLQDKPPVDTDTLRQRIVELMQSVYDPEIPVNIYELGMVYDIQVDAEGNATVSMTLTSPACPVAGSLPGEVEWRLGTLEGLKSAKVNLVWEPPWTPEKMSEAAKLQLGMM